MGQVDLHIPFRVQQRYIRVGTGSKRTHRKIQRRRGTGRVQLDEAGEADHSAVIKTIESQGDIGRTRWANLSGTCIVTSNIFALHSDRDSVCIIASICEITTMESVV